MDLPNHLSRRLALEGAALDTPPPGPAGHARVQGLVERLGYVQLDSVLTVERAHHMILFARDRAYRPAHLARLLERERTLFEHWTHDACAIPVAHYRHWKPRFARSEAPLRERWRRWQGDGFEAEIGAVLARLEREGPLAAEDLDRPGDHGGGGFWNWTPQKTAIEFLWHTGRVAVARRESFRKVYDLAERVHPEGCGTECPDPDAHRDWACREALARLHFATPGEIAGFWNLVGQEEARVWAAENLERIVVAGADGSPRRLFAPRGLAERAAALPEPAATLRVLSPFDPLIRNRTRALHVFGFDYRIEIFTPAAKRRYGYYVFPLLEGDRFVGRIDMKADRQAGTLVVAALWPEPGAVFGKGRLRRLEAEIARVARFAGCGRVAFADGWLRP